MVIMSEIEQKFIRTPSQRCRIADLVKGLYNEDEKTISTVFGPIRRARLVCHLIYKKITSNQSDDSTSMIKSTDENAERLSFLIDDGSGKLWITLWNTKSSFYQNIDRGDLIHTVGTVKKKNDGGVIFYPDFIAKITDPNIELLHELEMIKFIKNNGKSAFNEDVSYQNPMEEDENIENMIQLQEKEEIIDKTPTITNEFDEFEDLDDFGELDDFDQSELEDAIITTIENNDDGDGVSVGRIVKKLGISEDLVIDLLKKLSLNTKVYTTNSGKYKIYS